MEKEMLYDILMTQDVVTSINDNMGIVCKLIPEIKDMMGFSHNHPHHHLDVWNHTLLALSYSSNDFAVRVVLLLHDIGKPHSYQDGDVRHFKGHPLVSSKISEVILERLGFSNDEIIKLCYLIREHDSLITDSEINNDIDMARVKFNVQCCDALAHNPLKLEKRIKYLLDVNEKLYDTEDRVKCIVLIINYYR